MNKQERVTFVINTLKEFYPTIPIPLDHKDLTYSGSTLSSVY